MSATITITSPSHFSTLLSTSRIVVADFYADWCGPCKAIAPVYEQLSTQLSRPQKITFTKINTDEQKSIAQTYNISAMPTFLIFKSGREIKRVRGADPKGLNEAVKQLAAEVEKTDDEGGAGEGSSSSGSGGKWTGAAAPRGYGEVTEEVDIKGLDFLNLDGEKGDKRAVFSAEQPSTLATKSKAPETSDWIESDTDEQIMLFIPFQSTIKLHTIHITSIPQPEDTDIVRPKTVHLYANRSHVLGFDEAEDTPATQTISISEQDWDSKTNTAKLELRFVKFQNISSVTVFLAEGDGEGEKMRVDRVRLFGETGEKRAMGKLEKVEHDH